MSADVSISTFAVRCDGCFKFSMRKLCMQWGGVIGTHTSNDVQTIPRLAKSEKQRITSYRWFYVSVMVEQAEGCIYEHLCIGLSVQLGVIVTHCCRITRVKTQEPTRCVRFAVSVLYAYRRTSLQLHIARILLQICAPAFVLYSYQDSRLCLCVRFPETTNHLLMFTYAFKTKR